MQSFRKKKSLGQHFLTNKGVADAIAEAGDITKGETVLEIGPGTGMLTEALLRRGARVIAVEADDRAIAVLSETFKSEIDNGSLSITHGDIREISLDDLRLKAGKYKVIANIPYYISGALFRMLLSGDHQPNTLVFLVQKEVAERIAREKKESLLSLSTKAYGVSSYISTVKRGNFSPAPKVDSAILKVSDISRKRFKNLDEGWFFKLLHAGFASRRKQLFGSLKSIVGEKALTAAFLELSIPIKARGEDLTIEQWTNLAQKTEPEA